MVNLASGPQADRFILRSKDDGRYLSGFTSYGVNREVAVRVFMTQKTSEAMQFCTAKAARLTALMYRLHYGNSAGKFEVLTFSGGCW